jgi:hypothetical protein
LRTAHSNLATPGAGSAEIIPAALLPPTTHPPAVRLILAPDEDDDELYPDAPDNTAKGGAASRRSTYLHLVVCQLEFESVRALLGAEPAAAVIREAISEGQSGLGYFWIYQKVLDDQERLSGLIREHKLTLPGMP